MVLLFNFLWFFASILVLIISGYYLVKSMKKLCGYLKISEFLSGFIILAIGTSIPELFVGISSALNKSTSISLGNVIGANIADITFVIGIPILLVRGFKIKSKETVKDSFIMVIIASLPLTLMIIGNQLSKIDGIILITVFFSYIYYLWMQRGVFTRHYEENKFKRYLIIVYTLLFLITIFFVIKSADYAVKYAISISEELDLPKILIGLFLVAIGTTIPELIVGINTIIRGYSEMGIGNVIGSVVVNSTLILGVTSLIYPITANFLLFITSGIYMLIVCFIFATFIASGNRLDWREGVSLVLLYIFFVIFEFYIELFAGA